MSCQAYRHEKTCQQLWHFDASRLRSALLLHVYCSLHVDQLSMAANKLFQRVDYEALTEMRLRQTRRRAKSSAANSPNAANNAK